jgi:two-component system sensor histidine kinase QseC
MKSVARTLCYYHTAITVLAISLFSLGLYNYIEAVLINEVDIGLGSRAKTMSQLVEIEPGEIDLEFEELYWDEFDHETATASYFMFNANGRLISSSANADMRQLQAIYQQTTATIIGTDSPLGGNLSRYIIYPFKPKLEGDVDYDQGIWNILITEDLGQIFLTLKSLVFGCLICGSMFVLFSSLLHYWNTHRGLQPLRSIEQQVEGLDSSKLHDRFSTDQLPKELKLIAAKLNDLLDRLDASFKRERSFSSNAAHELRTPLAELKAIVQVGMEREVAPQAGRYFSDADQVIRRMQSLLNALLTLANGSRQVSPPRCELDLGKLLQDKVNEARKTAPACDIQLHSPETFKVLANETLLHGIIDNLLANALEYADPCQPISCRVLTNEGMSSLQFSNRCESLDEADLAVMADTFWRKESARSDSNHHGLGLTLVQTYAQCMHLKFTISRLQSKEVAFTLSGFETKFGRAKKSSVNSSSQAESA